MKKIILSFFIFGVVFLGYEGMQIYSMLDVREDEIGYFRLYDRGGVIIANLPKSGGYSIPYEGKLDTSLIQNIITIEDRRFFEHRGVDVMSKLGALISNLRGGATLRGGSTITEQYVKNRYFPGRERTILQKIREAYWAIIVELRYPKEKILKNYLETVYMGNGIYGIQTAVENYFPEETIESLTTDHRIELITRLRYPNLGSGSREYGVRLAGRLGVSLSESDFPERSRPEWTDLLPFLTTRIENEIENHCHGEHSHIEKFLMRIPSDICTSHHTSLFTSIDLDASIYASLMLESTLFPLEERNVHNGAIYAWDEQEQKILIYIGNRTNATGNAIDMIQERRSVGSTLKPFIYLMALISGADPNDLILDDTKPYETAQTGLSYVPENYIPKSYGPVTLRDALGNSLNSASVRLAEYIGIGRIYASFRSLGLDLDHDAGYYGYGIALGAVELTLENVVEGYRHLTDLKKGENYLLYDMLSDGANRAMTFGISSILNTSIPMAVKTGTSTDFRDNWTIGYNDEIILGVWVGNADSSSMDDVSGVTGAGPVYHAVAEDLIARGYIHRVDPNPPTGLMTMSLCMDERCLQKEIVYTRQGYERKSRPKSNIFFRSDFVTPLTEEEIEKWKIR